MRTIFILLFAVCAYNAHSQNAHQDLDNARIICEKGVVEINSMEGFGDYLETFDNLSCIQGNAHETNSTWFSWTCLSAGTLAFIIEPYDPTNDIDFIIYKKSLEGAEEVRCMASGTILNAKQNTFENCLGTTGLSSQSFDKIEMEGCEFVDDNFLKYLSMEADDQFYMVVNNFNSAEGMSILFEGTAELSKIEACKEARLDEAFSISSILPNPAEDYIQIAFQVSENREITTEVFSLSGNLVLREFTSVQPGSNHIKLNIENLPSASYILKVKSDEKSLLERFSKI